MAIIVSIMVLVILSIVPPNAYDVSIFIGYHLMFDGIDIMNDFGNNCKPFTVRNLAFVPKSGKRSLFQIYMWLVIDTFIYLMVYSYFVNIFPGQYGHAKTWLYPIEKVWKVFQRYFCRRSKGAKSSDTREKQI